MQEKYREAFRPAAQVNHPAAEEIDYSPKTYSLREKLIFGLKLLLITGICCVLIWLIH